MNDTYDPYYEAEGAAAASEAEHNNAMAFEEHLLDLIEKKEFYKYALLVALQELQSREYSASGMTAKEWFTASLDRIESKKSHQHPEILDNNSLPF